MDGYWIKIFFMHYTLGKAPCICPLQAKPQAQAVAGAGAGAGAGDITTRYN